MTTRARQRRVSIADEQAAALRWAEDYLASGEGRASMVAWLTQNVPELNTEVEKERLQTLPILDLAREFAHRQYMDELMRVVVSRPANELDIPLLGRAASEYVAARVRQSERGRRGGKQPKTKEGILLTACQLAREHPEFGAKKAFKHLWKLTERGEPMTIPGWKITAERVDGRRTIRQENTASGKVDRPITFDTFRTEYWPQAKREARS